MIEVHLMWLEGPATVVTWTLAEFAKCFPGRVLTPADTGDLAVAVASVVVGVDRALVPPLHTGRQ
jgi:hypothetical protein